MGRQPRYSAEQLLDTAANLVATKGPAAVTMSAVAAAAGAPSGSVYHRFPDRPSLQAALWLTVIRDFHASVTPLLDGDPVEAAITCARATVRWCRTRHDLACVLVTGRDAFEPATWAADDLALVEAEQRSFERQVRQVMSRLKRTDTGIARERLALATLDLPYAAVRRYLTSKRRVPRSLEAAVESAARALLLN